MGKGKVLGEATPYPRGVDSAGVTVGAERLFPPTPAALGGGMGEQPPSTRPYPRGVDSAGVRGRYWENLPRTPVKSNPRRSSGSPAPVESTPRGYTVDNDCTYPVSRELGFAVSNSEAGRLTPATLGAGRGKQSPSAPAWFRGVDSTGAQPNMHYLNMVTKQVEEQTPEASHPNKKYNAKRTRHIWKGFGTRVRMRKFQNWCYSNVPPIPG
jgi:hypothetical protein